MLTALHIKPAMSVSDAFHQFAGIELFDVYSVLTGNVNPGDFDGIALNRSRYSISKKSFLISAF